MSKKVFIVSFSGFGVEFPKDKTPVAYGASMQTIVADDVEYIDKEFIRKTQDYKSAIQGLSDDFKAAWKLEVSVSVFNTGDETVKMDLLVFNGNDVSTGISIKEKLDLMK